MEQSHPSLWISILASAGSLARVQPLRWSIDVVLWSLGVTERDGDPRVGPMSRSWLRQQEAEAGKHDGGGG